MNNAVESLIEAPHIPEDRIARIRRRSSRKKTLFHFIVVKRVRLMSGWSSEEVLSLLSQFGEKPFTKLPSRLRIELRMRRFSFGPRQPNQSERLEAESDARDHRKYTFTETLDDLINFYRRSPDNADE